MISPAAKGSALRTSMDAVLPLTAADLERASLLLESLAVSFSGLGKLWVICPDHEVSLITRALSCRHSELPWQVRGEASVVPELAFTPWLQGWYRQQLVKLAIHESVESELYLTLDADVVCTKRVSPELLAPRGLGPCHVTTRDLHPDWYRGSEALLGVTARRRGVSHNVTPAVLHRRGVAELAQYLERKAAIGAFSSGLRGLKQRLLWAREAQPLRRARGLAPAPRRGHALDRVRALLHLSGSDWTLRALSPARPALHLRHRGLLLAQAQNGFCGLGSTGSDF